MDYLKNNLSESRYKHTLAVAAECDRMAEIFSLAEDDRRTLHAAALLHDITKEKTPDEQISLCRVYRIEYPEVYCETPALFHAKTGGPHARKLFPGLCTDRVADLISTHTTGCADMSLMQKLLLLADGIEETRKHRHLIELRSYFYTNPEDNELSRHLDICVIKYLDMTISYLISSGQAIDTETVNARNDLILKTR